MSIFTQPDINNMNILDAYTAVHLMTLQKELMVIIQQKQGMI